MSEPATADRRWRSGLAIAALIAIGAAYFGPLVLARGYLFLGDMSAEDYPLRVFLTQCVRAGHLPLWNPHIFGGFPQFAEGETAPLYPLSLLAALFLPSHVALTWLVVLHRLLAGAFMFLFARARGLGRSSSLLAGLVFMFSGFLFAMSQNWGIAATAAYLPLLLCFVEWGLRTRRPIFALPAAGTLAWQSLIGAPQIVYVSALAALCYAAFRVVADGPRRTAAPAAALVLGAFALGAGLAAVQLWPTLTMAQASFRTAQSRFDFMTSYGVPPRLLGLYLAPNTWGNPAYADYRGPDYYWHYIGYIGIVPLALACVGVAARFRRQWPLAALAALGLCLALGRANPAYHLLQYVPAVNAFRVPARYLLIVTVCLAALAGEGHQHLLARAGSRRTALGGVIVGLLMAGWAALAFGALPPEARYSLALDRGWLAPLAVILSVAGAIALVALTGRGLLSRPAFTALATTALLADLLPWGATQMPVVEASYLTKPPAAARVMLRDRGWFRMIPWWESGGAVAQPPWKDVAALRRLRERLTPDLPAAYGLNTLEGHAGLVPARQVAFYHMARLVFKRTERDTRILDAAGVRYIVSAWALPRSHLELVHRGTVWLYRNPHALGPCWVVPRAAALTDADQASDFMLGDDFAPAAVAVLEQEVGPLTSSPERLRAGARAVRLEPTEMEFEAWASDAALLVINAAAYDPGWTATLDGAEAPIYPADEMFQAVYLPAGRHRIVLRYESLAYLLGRQVSLATAVLIAAVLIWRARRRGHRAEES